MVVAQSKLAVEMASKEHLEKLRRIEEESQLAEQLMLQLEASNKIPVTVTETTDARL